MPMQDLKNNVEQLLSLLRVVTLELVEKLQKIEVACSRELPAQLNKNVQTQPEDKNTPMELLWSARKAAKSLGICERTLWSLTQQGEIPSIRFGRRVLFNPKDLQAWIESKSPKSSNRE
jgi:excisionase family DNA binding protein